MDELWRRGGGELSRSQAPQRPQTPTIKRACPHTGDQVDKVAKVAGQASKAAQENPDAVKKAAAAVRMSAFL